MRLDAEFYGSINLNPVIVRNQGLDTAIREALRKLDFKIEGSVYIPDSWDNNELFDTFDDRNINDEYSYDENNLILMKKEEAPNKYLKSVLETIED
jgi:hypothetical protein